MHPATNTCDDGGDVITDTSSGSDILYGGNVNTSGTGNDGNDTLTSTGDSTLPVDLLYGGNDNAGGSGTDGVAHVCNADGNDVIIPLTCP